ncbi:MAG TPA: GNAT family N-acetyltransferase [Streptosporangiaceae bacterium]|jgi:GNAT superfamily N-acetyltransferase
MAVTIRDARAGDAEAVAGAWLDAADFYAGLEPRVFQIPRADGLSDVWRESLTSDAADALHLVAELDGQVIGYLVAQLAAPEPGADFQLTRDQSWTRLMIEVLVVRQEHWRLGAGAALLTAAEEWGRELGARMVRLDTYAHSPVSVPFYEQRMGYRRRAIIFEKPLLPEETQ